ncbi:MAG: adenylate/guanylate cyclase domain-containing protein [Bacteroidota bacterium]
MDEPTLTLWTKSLKQVLVKDKAALALLKDIGQRSKVEFAFFDMHGRLLLGEAGEYPEKVDLVFESEVLGVLKSTNPETQLLVDVLHLLVKKEFDKKKIGKEVLGLYREINTIYDLGEQISEKIDATSIAEIALRESAQIIGASHGMFLMYDNDRDQVEQMASFGENPNAKKNISDQNEVLKKLILKGNAAIVPQDRVKANPSISHLNSAMYAPLKVKHRTLGMVILGNRENKEFKAAELKLLTTIALQSAAAIESAYLYQKGLKEARDREEAIRRIYDVSQKFVPSEFIKSLGKNNITEVALGDLVEKEVTVVFADIRGFTTVSEGMNPKENFMFVNAFNNRMGPVIRRNHGFILQYLGDGFMALFPKGAQDAVRASVQMQNALHEYNKERVSKGRLPIKVGMGMQNGKLIMGITGDVERLDAAIISDTVNTAARIEGLSKHYGTSILLTQKCKAKLTNVDEFNFRYLGPVQVKGKQKAIDLYECINGDEPSLRDHKLRTLPTFDHAMTLYFNKEFAMAAVTFQQLFKLNVNDQTAKLFLNKSAQLITQEIGDGWQGVETMTTK